MVCGSDRMALYETGQRLLQNAAAFREKTMFFAFFCVIRNGAKVITKCGSFFLLQNGAKVITKCGSYFYYKTRQRLLQNAAGITKRGKGYYKMRQVLQNGQLYETEHYRGGA